MSRNKLKRCAVCPWLIEDGSQFSCPIKGRKEADPASLECNVRRSFRLEEEKWGKLVRACHKQRNRAMEAEKKHEKLSKESVPRDLWQLGCNEIVIRDREIALLHRELRNLRRRHRKKSRC